jgi:DNA topoisomerase-1
MPRAAATDSPKSALPVGGLRFSSDDEPGLRRLPGRGGFAYRDPSGKRVRDRETVERIRALAIPPAWTDVWICADARGHLQATGRDAKGRKQYRYHGRWREQRETDKFEHVLEFAAALPRIRRRVRSDLALPGLPRRKVLAAIVRLLEDTCIRVGNERYAEENESFGLTTMRNRHVKVNGSRVEFQFRGKSGKFHRIAVDDPRLSRIVGRCRELPGQSLFEYLDDDGAVQSVGSTDVNEYLKEASGHEVTTKDFRTWNGTVLVASELARRAEPVGPSHMVAAVRQAAQRLGNTPAICRKSYVHPKVLDPRTWQGRDDHRARRRAPSGLRAEEAAAWLLLQPAASGASRRPRPRPSTSTPSRSEALRPR